MNREMARKILLSVGGGAVLAGALLAGTIEWRPAATPEALHSVIIQGEDAGDVLRAVEAVGGVVVRELRIINGVSAELTDSQLEALKASAGGLRIHENAEVETSLQSQKIRQVQ